MASPSPENETPGAAAGRLVRSAYETVLVARAAGRTFVLPLDRVEEIGRPQAVEPTPGAPACVLGVALIRGAALPVLDVSLLLGGHGAPATRWIVIRVAGRRAALAVESVNGVEEIEFERYRSIPPLVRDASTDLVAAIGARDGALVSVLETAHLLAAGSPGGAPPA